MNNKFKIIVIIGSIVGAVVLIELFFYILSFQDPGKRVPKELSLRYDAFSNRTTKYEYDEQNRILSEAFKSVTGIVTNSETEVNFSYDENGRLFKVITYSFYAPINKFDSITSWRDTILLSYHDRFIITHSSSSTDTLHLIKLDKDDNFLEKTDYKNNMRIGTSIYTYNKNMNIISIDFTSSDSTLNSRTTVTYDDKKGLFKDVENKIAIHYLLQGNRYNIHNNATSMTSSENGDSSTSQTDEYKYSYNIFDFPTNIQEINSEFTTRVSYKTDGDK